jgi:hypothetical protein
MADVSRAGVPAGSPAQPGPGALKLLSTTVAELEAAEVTTPHIVICSYGSPPYRRTFFVGPFPDMLSALAASEELERSMEDEHPGGRPRTTAAPLQPPDVGLADTVSHARPTD